MLWFARHGEDEHKLCIQWAYCLLSGREAGRMGKFQRGQAHPHPECGDIPNGRSRRCQGRSGRSRWLRIGRRKGFEGWPPVLWSASLTPFRILPSEYRQAPQCKLGTWWLCRVRVGPSVVTDAPLWGRMWIMGVAVHVQRPGVYGNSLYF